MSRPGQKNKVRRRQGKKRMRRKTTMKPRLAQWQLGVWQCYEELQLLISELLHRWWQPCKLILKLTEGTERGPTVYLNEGGQCKNYQWSRNGNGSVVFCSGAAGQMPETRLPLESGICRLKTDGGNGGRKTEDWGREWKSCGMNEMPGCSSAIEWNWFYRLLPSTNSTGELQFCEKVLGLVQAELW